MNNIRSVEDIMGHLWSLIPSPIGEARDLDVALGYISGVLDGMHLQNTACHNANWDRRIRDVLGAISPELSTKQQNYLTQALKLVLDGEKATLTGEYEIYEKVAFLYNAKPGNVKCAVTAAMFKLLADMTQWTAKAIFGESYEQNQFPPTWVTLTALADAIRQDRI